MHRAVTLSNSYADLYVSGGFLSEAGWYENAEKILATSYKLCNTREQDGGRIATKFLTRYQRLSILIYKHLLLSSQTKTCIYLFDDKDKVWIIQKGVVKSIFFIWISEVLSGFFSLEVFSCVTSSCLGRYFLWCGLKPRKRKSSIYK